MSYKDEAREFRPEQTELVTRLEVIDYRDASVAKKEGRNRAFHAMPCRVELSLQDDGRTLKVFVNDANRCKE